MFGVSLLFIGAMCTIKAYKNLGMVQPEIKFDM